MKLFGAAISLRKGLAGVTLLLCICTILVSMLWNYKLAEVINLVNKGQFAGMKLLSQIFGLLFTAIIVQAATTFLSGYTCERINHDLRMMYAARYMVKDISFFEDMSTGRQLSKLQNEVNEVSAYISSNLFQLINDLLKFIVTFIWLITLNFHLALTANLPVLFIVIYVVYSSKVIGKMASLSQQENQRMNGMADTILTLFPVIKLYGAGKLMIEQYDLSVDSWEKTSIKEECARSVLMSLSAVLTCLPLLLLLLVGGKLVILKNMDIGVLYLFINLSGNVSGVMMNMPGYIGNFRRFAANLARL